MITDVVTSDFLSYVFDEIIGIIPNLIPVTIGLVAIVKGVGFLKTMLYSAQAVAKY